MSLKCAHGAAPRGTGGSRSWDGGHGGGGDTGGGHTQGLGTLILQRCGRRGGLGAGFVGAPPPHPPVLDVNDIFKKKKKQKRGEKPPKNPHYAFSKLVSGPSGEGGR